MPKLLDRGYEVDGLDLFWFGNHLPSETGIIRKDIFEISVPDLEPHQQGVFLTGLSNDPMAEYSHSENFIFNAAAPAYPGLGRKKGQGETLRLCQLLLGVRIHRQRVVRRNPAGFFVLSLRNLKAPGRTGRDELSRRRILGHLSAQRNHFRLQPAYASGLNRQHHVKNGVRNCEITVNNPSIWRPIMSIEDATNGYTRAIEASQKISGIFNIASGNYTVGEVGDLVKMAIEEQLGIRVHLTIHHKTDVRSYKVSIEKAENVLSFHANHNVKAIVKNLIEHMDKFQDWNNPQYYNIDTLKLLSANNSLRSLAEVAR